MTALRNSAAARRDLAGIYAYTLRNRGQRQADGYLADLGAASQHIADGSAIACRLTFRNDAIWQVKQGRHLIVFQHRAVDTVLIIRILLERMDIEGNLGNK